MHTRTIVLLPPDCPNLWAAGAELLKRHRIDDNDMDRPWRLDYWTVGGGTIANEVTARALGVQDDPDLAQNVCWVARLRPDFVPGAVVTPEGAWYDLSDHGWRFLDGETPANRAAEAKWVAQVRELFAAHASCMAVEFDTHS